MAFVGSFYLLGSVPCYGRSPKAAHLHRCRQPLVVTSAPSKLLPIFVFGTVCRCCLHVNLVVEPKREFRAIQNLFNSIIHHADRHPCSARLVSGRLSRVRGAGGRTQPSRAIIHLALPPLCAVTCPGPLSLAHPALHYCCILAPRAISWLHLRVYPPRTGLRRQAAFEALSRERSVCVCCAARACEIPRTPFTVDSNNCGTATIPDVV